MTLSYLIAFCNIAHDNHVYPEIDPAILSTLLTELQALRDIAKATNDTLSAVDDWLGMASTRQAALDSLWRLRRMLQQAGYEYTSKGTLDWRGSLVKELNDAGFYNSPDGMRYDPTAADSKPYRVYGNAIGPMLKEIVGELQVLRNSDVEYLSTRLPDDTTDCQSLALDYQACLGRVMALKAENDILRGYIRGEVTWDQVEKQLDK